MLDYIMCENGSFSCLKLLLSDKMIRFILSVLGQGHPQLDSLLVPCCLPLQHPILLSQHNNQTRDILAFPNIICTPLTNNNNKSGVFPQVESGEGSVYSNLTPTFRKAERLFPVNSRLSKDKGKGQ